MTEQPPAAREPEEPSAPPESDIGSVEHEARPTWQPRGSPPAAVLGAILLAVGVVLLIGQQLNVDLGDLAWPVYVIAPGLVLLAFGLTQAHGSGLTVTGSIVTTVGLVLAYQNATDHWESWAYAWALVGPGGSGIGMLLYGVRSANRSMATAGFWQVLSALGLFVVGFIFFEGLIGISGRRFPVPDWVLPAAVIGLGAVVLVRGLTARRTEPES